MGLGFDFPTEGLLLLLTGIGIVLFIRTPKLEIFQGVGALFILQFCWFLFTALWAEYPLLSVKFILAKIWYIIPFFLIPYYTLRSKSDLSHLLRLVLYSVLIAGLYTFLKHGFDGWSFATRTNAGAPIFRNHVNYACILLLSLPICYYLYRVEKKAKYLLFSVILLTFLFFTYARIAYVAILLSLLCLVLLRIRWLKAFLVLSSFSFILSIAYIVSGDKLLQFAPDYQKTISHDEFGRLIDATYRLQDISSMERAYRWMAGLNILAERPLKGIGPSNFYSTYQAYTVRSFQTYVSDNPEKSGIHNYFLMTAVEQGLPGLIILVSIFIYLLLAIIATYRTTNPSTQLILELALLWLIIIISINLLNDMLEVIKVGPFFFFTAYLIQNGELLAKEDNMR